MKNFASICAFLFCLLLFVSTPSAFAHDEEFGDEDNPYEIDWVGSSQTLDLDHNDMDPWKGWATIYMINICGEDWGDFHLEVRDIGWGCADVNFSETIAPELYIRTGVHTWDLVEDLIWEVDNDAYNATLDMVFYDNPIEHGDIVKIKVYTDNHWSMYDWFRICAYPTPVPEPATLALLGLGAFVLLRKRR
jgi:hypothetical protein